MNINGQNTLACLCRIDRDSAKDSKIYPLPHSTSLCSFFALSVSFTFTGRGGSLFHVSFVESPYFDLNSDSCERF